MSPQIKLYLLYYFPIMHFDASTKFQIWWCTFFAEVQKTTLAGCIEDLEGLYLDTKNESEDDFDVHNCAFEVAFDECTQLYIQSDVSGMPVTFS